MEWQKIFSLIIGFTPLIIALVFIADPSITIPGRYVVEAVMEEYSRKKAR